MEEYFEELKEQLPKIIVVQKSKYDANVEKLIRENNYSIIWVENNSKDLTKATLVLKLEK